MATNPSHSPSFTDISALYVNCTLKKSPEMSHTQGLMDRSMGLMRRLGVSVESLRLVDFDVARGVYPDMTGHGWDADVWPTEIWPKVRDADILVIGGPLWLGESSSVARTLVERLYAMSAELNANGQYIYYGKTGGVMVTGNEDGVKHAAMSMLYSLQHIGYTIPPGADAGWIGEVGPGPSYLDPESGGPENDFTNRNTTFMTWNLLHMARMLKDAGGIPAHGNLPEQWDAGERFGFQ